MATNYNSMTIDELKKYANDNGIDRPLSGKTKSVIINIISEFENNKRLNELEKLTLVELKEFAAENRIQIPSSRKKADIIAAIVKAENGDIASANQDSEEFMASYLQTKPGRTILKSNDRGYNASFKLCVYTICPKCGEEVYAYCYTETDNETANKNPRISGQLKNCPKCKYKLGLTQGRYSQEYIEKNAVPKYTPMFKALRKSIDEINRDSFREEAKQLVNKIQNIDAQSNDTIRQLSCEEIKQS